jgi:hypothetical protein
MTGCRLTKLSVYLDTNSSMKLSSFMQPDQEPVDPDKPKWLSYEELATYLLNRMRKEFGFERVEAKQEIHGKRSGTSWEIDAKGITEGRAGVFHYRVQAPS